MAYTNTWTVAAPLDTQAANQGAVDFRATKLDIMQRVASFGAGILANRPTPEATSGTADWTGVMYWTTDTFQVFRWNGASWDDITSVIASSYSPPFNLTTTSVDPGPYTITNPGSATAANSISAYSFLPGALLIKGAASKVSGSNSCTISLRSGAGGGALIAQGTVNNPGDIITFTGTLRRGSLGGSTQYTYAIDVDVAGVVTPFAGITTGSLVPSPLFLSFGAAASFVGTGIILTAAGF